MKIYDVDVSTLEAIAYKLGVRFEGRDESNSRGARSAGVLRARYDVANPYPRRSRPMLGKVRRMPHCVCWHGHRDFMRAVFEHNPAARIVAAGIAADYKGQEDFERCYRSTGTRNIGSMMEPCSFASACDCPESGRAQ